jgi:HlyD family secretion protein
VSRPLARAVALLAAALPACTAHDDGLHLVGTVERTLVELVAPSSEVVTAINAERGDRLEPGQVVVQLDTTFARVDVARAEAALASARTAELVAAQELLRVRRLRAGHVASDQDLDRARLSHDEAAARLREAEAGVVAARKHVEDLSLAAPVPAVLDQLPYDVGERVPAGAVLAVLLRAGDPWVRVWVPEESVARVLPGTPALVHVDGVEGELSGSVIDVAREPEFTPHYALTERDRVYLVYETRVRIENPPAELRPGTPAQVQVQAPRLVAESPP